KTISPDPLCLPMPESKRLAKLAEDFIHRPHQVKSLEEWAELVHLSKRSFTRHFREQTGLSFAKWCQQARVVRALEWLEKGKPVTWIALHLGYNSVSAFIKVFSEYVGQTPGRYIKAKQGDTSRM